MTQPKRLSRAATALSAVVATAAILPIAACAQTTPATPATQVAANAVAGDFRPPAVPLVTSDPYLSIWSEADHLNDANTRHWTQRENSLVSLIRIDGATFRLMGQRPRRSGSLSTDRLSSDPDPQHLYVRR